MTRKPKTRNARSELGLEPHRVSSVRRLFVFFLLKIFLASGCESFYPEVVVLNKTNEFILLKDLSFQGCSWNIVLAFEEATAPGWCLPGNDRIHFKKFDAQAYCREQVEDGTLDGLCLCANKDPIAFEPPDGNMDGLINTEPTWFNYQTISIQQADYGEFHLFEVTLDNMEQDFSVPGPYGH